MFRLSVVFLSSLLLGTLCACSKQDKTQEGWFRDRSGDYVKNAEEGPLLKVPEPARTEPFSQDYQIPE
jgi:uncharacterized lipoprotein